MSSGPASTVPSTIGTPTARAASVDRRGGVGVAQRVDVRGVLRPQHHVRARAATGGDVRGELLGDPHVVVEHRAALRVEVQAEPRHVALHGRDRHGAHRRRAGGREQRGQRTGRQRDQRDQRGRDGGAHLPPGQAPPGLPQREAGQHGDERQQRRPADGGHGEQRPVGLAEGDAPPGEAAERHPRPQRLRADPHRRRPHRRRRAAATPRPSRRPRPRRTRASAAESASHGTGPT